MYDQKVASFFETDLFGLYSTSHDLALKQLDACNAVLENVLDIGCGTGWFLEKLVDNYNGLGFSGSDSSLHMLEIARSKPKLANLSIFRSNLQQLNQLVPAQSFDMVSLHYVLSYVPKEIAFPIIAKLITPGGLFSLATMTKENSFSALQKLAGFIDKDEADSLSHTPSGKEDLLAYIESSGLFKVEMWNTLERSMPFESRDQLSDFIFRSGWVLEVAEKYQSDIERAIQDIKLPIQERFCSEVILLRSE
uniref:Methyltransferase domain-containing protein n=1 Tax=Candidatus Kentrum sp. FM TaxID=2126340 RepID=A0A450TK68_9GAMM|nr:MAG: Methyltransferase domain-containing protein [Candidatus Kentron sp. FM]VFJ67970.1 MAG: Methyltransferase domain-containing protein [Candidatus Kentron sp. FM]VFK10305.1 MAG: Methyltransferase domain-containing protein [Candidatus Kentron sp. FM]